MTKEREWPNNQRVRRDEAARLLQAAVWELTPLVTRVVLYDKIETLRRQAAALVQVQNALRLLLEAGAEIN